MPWSVVEIAEAVAEGLKQRAREEDAEQVVYGFDHLDELGLHPLIHQALQAGGFGVWPEVRYPSDRGSRKRSEGKRCDVVLTPAGHRLREEAAKGTLFETPEQVDPQDAFWLEIKTVAQYEIGGPFRRYSAELLNTVTQDVKKLWCDELVLHAGLLLVLFTADAATADHDVAAWHGRCLDRGIPAQPPVRRGFALADRIGNGWCEVAVFAVRGV